MTFYLPTFLSKDPHDDGDVATYADLTSWKHAITYQFMDGMSLVQTSLLCPDICQAPHQTQDYSTRPF